MSPGLLYGNASLPMQGIVFDGVRFQDPPADGAFGKDYFFCKGVRHQTLHPPPLPCRPFFLVQTFSILFFKYSCAPLAALPSRTR